jgi:hypothetical protein
VNGSDHLQVITMNNYNTIAISTFYSSLGSRDSSVSIATAYGLDDPGGGGSSPSYKMGTGGSFPGVKWLECAADHSPPTSAEVEKMWIYTSTTPYVFMA